jgi:hypothetical protein
MGAECPLIMASTPAMNVVDTAPRPGIRTPSFPSGAFVSKKNSSHSINRIVYKIVGKI